jgi:hypothetical protein
VIVGVAQAGCCHFDQKLILPGAFKLELDDLPLSGVLEQNRCFGEQSDSFRLWLR